MTSFSVLASVYKKEEAVYLDRCLKSCWDDQVCKPNEIIVVEDGPLSPELYEVINKWEVKLGTNIFKVLKLPVNQGLAFALNRGIEASSNNIIFRMDTDDICHPNRFSNQLNYLQNNPDVDILGSWCFIIDENGNEIGAKKFPVSHSEIKRLIWTNPVVHPSIVFRKDRVEAIGSYDEKLARRQDYELWFRAIHKGLIFANIPEYLLYYRITDNYYVKNNLSAAWHQSKIGYRGLRLVGGNLFAYMAVFMPTFRALFPKKVAKFIHKIAGKFDPRSRLDS